MRIPRFFEPCELHTGQTYSLSDATTQHVSRVLRMKAGDNITLFNGYGSEFLCTLERVDKRHVDVTVISEHSQSRTSPLQIHIGQAISRGERMDYAIQKATELGMHCMTPLFTERCEVRLNNDRQDKRTKHWQQVAISACEQSLRNELPVIAPIQPLQQWLDNTEADLKLVLHHHTEQPLEELERPTSIALLIGPEGGLSEAEVEIALAAGFKPVAFGPRVMRTETAPVAAQAILQYLWGDLS
ncbi:16S rRNA (uracil(1498)-N(3))-methyltransferase [Neptunomonas japonica]|uniref:Ribosomal RNA small subunit methyltransferase E n=1 Tax=Neptunomonas japonica JAMM 1380 TaxID=1441457 RepID=A0A7R6SV14_9GAMM|nr:16S rRNA (uracil(1498)-N(3))-methyltransferase [Neptunomonas japonica]BBB28247.1 16S rRNA (uracil1498-N3)-methyltransferase [Neptunomonas japonica JAMM 1380]